MKVLVDPEGLGIFWVKFEHSLVLVQPYGFDFQDGSWLNARTEPDISYSLLDRSRN